MAKARLDKTDNEQLLAEIAGLKKKLNRRKEELIKTKSRLTTYRFKLQKMEATILYQRSRILELYRGEKQGADSII